MTERSGSLAALAEVFREHGFEGASLTTISKATGLGKGSLYNFFPGGKDEMMAAVLDDIDRWFEEAVFAPLEAADEPGPAIMAMMQAVTAYFQSGGRVCLVGWLGLGSSREAFADRVNGYFARWIATLAHCLQTGRVPAPRARSLAQEAVSGIQGAIVLSRALNDTRLFVRIVEKLESELLAAVARGES